MNLENFAPSCERNQNVILSHLTSAMQTHLSLLTSRSINVLEIGSYSGQHAIHFCQKLPNVRWQPSDIEENIAALVNNLAQFNLTNCLSPIALDVSQKSQWPTQNFDLIFTSNTLHIMSWQHVESLFTQLEQVISQGTLLVVYGPFKYQGEFTSSSNEKFECWLQDRNRQSGIRDFEKVNQLADQVGFKLMADIAMPANNQLLIWQKQS